MSDSGCPCVIVKIGGSVLRESFPSGMLAHLAGHPGRVAVPGGGVFADAVRDAQPHMGFSDAAAHAMAILAMEQMAHALCDLEPAFVPCRTLAALRAPRPAAALWFPAQMLLGAPDIPESWAVTSDSLALWLAKTLDAARLVLVKAPGAAVPSGPVPRGMIAALATSGLVDGAFEGLAASFKGSIVLANADDSKALAEALVPETPAEDHP